MSRALDRLTLLETFARIAERGSISAAARDLGLSQASASRQLAELERRLGVELIRRTTHSLALTGAGRDCLVEARGLLDGWDALEERFAEDSERLAGRIKVVAPIALGQTCLAPAVLTFQAAHPEVEIDWRLSDEVIRFAEAGCDLWIRIGSVPDETLAVRELGRVERLIVAAPGLIAGSAFRSPADLVELPCAALEPFEASSIPLTRSDGASETLVARAAIRTNNIFSALTATEMGLAYAVLPRWLVADALQEGRLVDVLPGWRAPSLVVNAAFTPARRRPRRVKALLDHLAEAVAATPGVDPV